MEILECTTLYEMQSYLSAIGLIHEANSVDRLLEIYEKVVYNDFAVELSESQQSKLLHKIDCKLNEIAV